MNNINDKLNEAKLADLSTDLLRQELARRVEQAKTQKQTRIKELQETIQKAQAELKELIGQDPQLRNKNQKVLDGLPGVVKAMMPKDLKQSLEDGVDITKIQQQPVQKARSGSPQVKRCEECGATSSNWEYSPNDDTMYCACGQVIAENAAANGYTR